MQKLQPLQAIKYKNKAYIFWLTKTIVKNNVTKSINH
jgi:hypothetical protein